MAARCELATVSTSCRGDGEPRAGGQSRRRFRSWSRRGLLQYCASCTGPQRFGAWPYVVGSTPDCARLAQGFLRCGLWPGARITVSEVGQHRNFVRQVAAEQVELLRARGREAAPTERLDLNQPPFRWNHLNGDKLI